MISGLEFNNYDYTCNGDSAMQGSLKQKRVVSFLVIVLFFSLTSFVHAQGGTAELGVFDAYQVAPGGVVQVPVSIRNVQGLYGLDFTLEFDPALVQVVDNDPSTPGIQAALGNFLDRGLLLFNSADNEKGNFHFAMAQYNPSEAKSGEGIVLMISFRGMAAGESPITVTKVQLASRDGIEIPSKGVDSTLTIRMNAPTQAATFPVVESTGLLRLGTFTPTPTATPRLIETIILQITPLEETQEAGGTSPTEALSGFEDGTKTSGSFLAENWWIVLIFLVVIIVVGVYLFMSKKKQ
jgi:hypothetical protein